VPFIALAIVLVIPLALIAMMPFALFQRYRAGTARRLARPWVATLNLVAMVFSVGFFLLVSGLTTVWVENAFAAAVGGVAVGAMLGLIGLWATRWEATPRSLHYTPNRWLVLAVTLVVTARLLYGFVRAWMTLGSTTDEASLIAAFGVPGSLGAGATVLGYYLAYGIGVRRRIGIWQKRSLRVM
jgi:hypothetical protein